VLRRFTLQKSEALLNRLVSLMVRGSLPDRELALTIDGTDVVVPDDSEVLGACGPRTRIETTVGKSGLTAEVVVVERALRLVTLFCQRLRIRLAAKIVMINGHESQSADGGFIGGPTLHEIDEMGITFVIPSKHTMAIATDASALAACGSGRSLKATNRVQGPRPSQTGNQTQHRTSAARGLCSHDQYAPN